MFGRFRKRIGLYSLKKEKSLVPLHRCLTNLKDARNIGILYALDDVPDYDVVSEFVTELQHEHKEVKALGFVKNKNLISRFLPKLSFDFFSKKDLNWFYRPVHAKVRDFIEKDFDILIDLSLQDNFPIKYISGLSKSLYKVGRYSEENTLYYDLLIDSKPNVSFQEYLSQVRHYLTIINSNGKNKQ